MKTILKLSTLALLVIAATAPAHAQTELLQSVTVNFKYYTQGPGVVNSSGGTNYIVTNSSFGTKQLIGILSSNGFKSGDMLVRVTPVTNVPVILTNLAPVGTNILLITNTSTSEEIVSNELILGTNTPIFIGNTNVTFGTNTAVIDGSTVTLGTNNAYYGTNALVVGTNTTVTVLTVTNAVGNIVGTTNIFVSNTLTNSTSGTNELGTPYWAIYNRHTSPKVIPITTNATFNIYTRRVYDDGTNLALMHGENIKHNGVIQFGTTDEIRALVLSNSNWNIKLQGYSHGHFVPVSLGNNDTVHSQDYTWTGNGSGTITNSTPIVIDGDVSEQYFRQ